MAKTKITNNNQVPNGGYSLGGYGAVPPTYSTTYPVTGSSYGNVTLTAAGTNGITYTTATTDATWAVQAYYPKTPEVEITNKDITIGGLSLKETMLAVKNELMLPTRINRNAELEKEFAELQAAAEQYYELERKFLEQKQMWETLKKTD